MINKPFAGGRKSERDADRKIESLLRGESFAGAAPKLVRFIDELRDSTYAATPSQAPFRGGLLLVPPEENGAAAPVSSTKALGGLGSLAATTLGRAALIVVLLVVAVGGAHSAGWVHVPGAGNNEELANSLIWRSEFDANIALATPSQLVPDLVEESHESAPIPAETARDPRVAVPLADTEGDSLDTDPADTEAPDGDSRDTERSATEAPDGDSRDTERADTEAPDGEALDTDPAATEAPEARVGILRPLDEPIAPASVDAGTGGRPETAPVDGSAIPDEAASDELTSSDEMDTSDDAAGRPESPTLVPIEVTPVDASPANRTDPVVDPVDPVEPVVDPVDPVADPVDPVNPGEPVVDPGEPVVDPVDPVDDPVDPVVDPVDPVVDPVDPVDNGNSGGAGRPDNPGRPDEPGRPDHAGGSTRGNG